ncbi:hypothetical protein IFR04_005822 [Cadophora malorum]|uniref:Uncharacterized protein n=1 Tax=Cadophora malorum TaxID=108018 RepID=A0A8H7TK18_9HELO|nr:hypothetical protein IFR04_005822 [Cadophora malorum]
MAAHRVDDIIREMLEDLDQRVDADTQRLLGMARHGAAAGWVDHNVEVFEVRVCGYVWEAATNLRHLVGPLEAFLIGAREKARVLDEVDLLGNELEEIALYGYSRDPYIPMSNNPYVPPPAPASAPRARAQGQPSPRRRRNSSPYVAPRDPKPALKPEPVPGEGSGPKPVPDKKIKKKGVPAWDAGGEDIGWDKVNEWGPAENWEVLAMHVTHKEKLDIKQKLKAEEEEQVNAAAARVPAKGGKAPAKSGKKPKA